MNLNAAMLPIVERLLSEYGENIFSNTPRVNAILLDLAPNMLRERILVRGFVEINGYSTLKNADDVYVVTKNRLVETMADTFCMEHAAAVWVVQLFAAVLGYEPFIDVSDMATEHAKPRTTTQHAAFVAIGKTHIVAAAADGTVYTHGYNEYYQCDVGHWRNIVAVAAGDGHTVGLRADGTVLTAGNNTYDQCDVGHLSDVISVYAFGHDTVCVRSDKTAYATGQSRLDLTHFQHIRCIAKHPEGVFGILEDGQVAYALHPYAEPAEDAEWAVSLTDVKQIIATYINGCIVLKNDGRLYKMNQPDNYFAQWRDVVSIVDLSDSFAILRADGTVRVLPYDREQPRKTTVADHWRGITAIYGKYKRLIGLTKDGGLLAVCTDPEWLRRNGSLDFVKDWYPVGAGFRPNDG